MSTNIYQEREKIEKQLKNRNLSVDERRELNQKSRKLYGIIRLKLSVD